MSVTAYIALGSNLGDRRDNLDRALAHLRVSPGIAVAKVSSYHETDPVGGPAGQGKFLNAAAELQTDLSPEDLLLLLLAVEMKLGRVRAERFGPRIIDLDMLLYDAQAVEIHTADLDLVVPHPRMHQRAFVLEPLVEIAPLAVHPGLVSTVQDLLRALRAANRRSTHELAGKRALVAGPTGARGHAIGPRIAA